MIFQRFQSLNVGINFSGFALIKKPRSGRGFLSHTLLFPIRNEERIGNFSMRDVFKKVNLRTSSWFLIRDGLGLDWEVQLDKEVYAYIALVLNILSLWLSLLTVLE